MKAYNKTFMKLEILKAIDNNSWFDVLNVVRQRCDAIFVFLYLSGLRDFVRVELFILIKC